ncbi:MAG: Exonuclease V subunit alpha [Candidatus Moranbacteria bacterium GW2011_GWC2_45_10]|nr:MAG: Exonuclease V subunit alpha [Candidatus Moranbacteria bacterium GW2011_GWC2_45_10]
MASMKQKTALDILKLGHSVFLTGPAGSGKTHVLKQYIEYLKKNNIGVAVTASTGIAATHMNGQTIHSWSGMGISEVFDEAEYAKLKKRHYHKNRFAAASVLIIDEISMLHAYQLDIVNAICKKFKNPFKPFGGLQVVLCGDFFQLPPVAKYGQQAQFVIESDSWKEMDPKICYLEEQHRQEDKEMLKILSDIRSRSCDAKTMATILSRENKSIASKITPTRLYTHNVNVDAINKTELQKIKEEARVFEMTSNGNEFLVSSVKKGCLAPEILFLKKGAVVMFVKNNFEQGYVNVTLGKVAGFNGSGMPIVETVSGKTIVATPEKWSIEENEKTLVSISQVPLRLAWAITVHKSQGMTLDAVEMDLSKSFEFGMGYVALSRVRTLGGIKLLGINYIALEVNPQVHEFDKALQKLSQKSSAEVAKMGILKKRSAQKEFLERCEA